MLFDSQAMRKVELVVSEKEVIPVTRALAASHAFHLIQSTPGTEEEPQESNTWQAQVNTYIQLEQRLQDVMETLDISPGEAPDGTEIPHIETDEAEQRVNVLAQETSELADALERARSAKEELEKDREQIDPLAGLDVNLDDFHHSQYTFWLFGTMPKDHVTRLETSLEHLPSLLVELDEKDTMATVGLFGPEQQSAILARAARSAYLNPLHPPESYHGTPDEAIATINEKIEGIENEIAQYREKLHHLYEAHIREVRQLYWRIRISRHIAEIILGYERIRYNYHVIAGWVPAPAIDDLQKRLNAVADQFTLEVTKPTFEDPAEIPFRYRNPKLIRAFEGLVDNYGHPRYGEMDPTVLLAVTFPLIFGLMFGDVGHGLILLALGGLITSRRLKALQSLAGLGSVLIACGVTSTGFGFLYGSLFGFEEVLPALWVHPLENIMTVLLVAIGFGVVTLSIGRIANIANGLIHQHWGAALVGPKGVAGLLFYWSLLGLAVGLFGSSPPIEPGILVPIAVISGSIVGLSGLLELLIESPGTLRDKNIPMVVIQSLFELFETLIGFLSNTLSYVRMGAFAVAHGALSLVVFIIARIVSPGEGLVYWVVVALGNLFVIGFEGMIVAIQTLRLEYYEFFDKFFDGGGQRYEPLSLTPTEA